MTVDYCKLWAAVSPIHSQHAGVFPRADFITAPDTFHRVIDLMTVFYSISTRKDQKKFSSTWNWQQYSFTMNNQTLSKLGIEDNSLTLIKKKSAFWNLRANIIIKDDLLEAVLLISGARHRCPQSPFLFDIVLEVLAIVISQEKEIKGIKVIKEEIKHSLFADYMIIYVEIQKIQISY